MKIIKRELYFKPIGQLTQKEFELLFNMPIDINDENFKKILEPIAEYSIFDINIEEYKINELNFNTAYLLGIMTALKQQIPKTYIIALFGESGCGKSHLINIISWLKQMNSEEIKEEDREKLGFAPKQFENDAKIREFKEMADSIAIIQKKTTRPSRDGKQNKPEIQEGMTLEEVQKCDWTYTITENLYGFSKKEVDEALEKGNAIVIVNDPELAIMKQLKDTYPTQLIPIQIFRTATEEEWINLMQKSHRTSDEIEKRRKNFGNSMQMYDKIGDIEFPEVILNLPKQGDTNKNLLLQLQGILNRHERIQCCENDYIER